MAVRRINSEEEALAVLAEVERLRAVKKPEFVDRKFAKQAEAIETKSYRKAFKTTRRAGKSMAIGRILFKEAYDFPGCSCLYMGLTKQTARKIMWKDVMKRLSRELELGASFNETTLTITLPNGSEIYLSGADADADEMEKFLGGKLRVAIIDEAGSFRIDLRKLIYENIEPALADLDGYVVMAGTPTSYTHGLFYEVTRDEGPREASWTVLEWNTFDNPYMEINWKKRLDRLVAENPRIVETPSYIRMYLGKWVTDLGDLCYKYTDAVNRVLEVPDHTFAYVLGIDLGFDDATAFIVAAYSTQSNVLYFVEAYKESGLDITAVAQKIKAYQKRFPAIYRMVVDNASKQAVEEMKNRHSLPLEAADKRGKADFIEIMNDEFKLGLIKLASPATDELAEEYGDLVWDKEEKEKSGKKVEHPNCENHLADAALYSWRYCYQYLSTGKEKPPPPKTAEEKVNEWEEQEAERVAGQRKKQFWET